MRIIGYIFIFLLLFVFIAFACVNASDVTLNYYFGQLIAPLSQVLALTFAAGCAIGMLFSGVVYLKQKKKQYQLKQQLRKIEEEVKNLRTLPVKDV